MEIKATIIGKAGLPFQAIYRDIESELDFEGKKIESVRAYCFYKDQLVVVHEKEGYWGIPGGRIEDDEDVREGARREVMEESNMKMVKMRFVGMQEVIKPDGSDGGFYIRVACLVEPEGDFRSDPANEVTEIKLIDPSTFIQLADAHWGKIAERMLERAIDLKKTMEQEVDFVK